MARKGMFALICFLSLPLPSLAGDKQTPTTLDSLVRIALAANPDIRAAQFDLAAAEYRAKTAGSLPDPMVSVGALNLPRTSLRFDETPMSGLSIGLSQAIPWPGKLQARASIARLQAQASAQSADAWRNSVVRQVRAAYYKYSHRVLAERILTENLDLTQNTIEAARVRYANGESSIQEVLRAQTAYGRLENRLRQTSQERRSAMAELNRLTNSTISADAELDAYLVPPEGPNVEFAPAVSGEQNPLLIGASLQARAAESRLKLVKADYWPDFTVAIDYGIRRDIPMDPVRGEDFISARIGLRLPLYFWSKQKNNSRAARQAMLAAESREQAVRKQIEQQLTDNTLALQTIRLSIAEYDETIIPQARAAWEAARIAYEVGQVDFDGLLASQMELLNIELERLDLLNQYHQKRAERDELLGSEYGK